MASGVLMHDLPNGVYAGNATGASQGSGWVSHQDRARKELGRRTARLDREKEREPRREDCLWVVVGERVSFESGCTWRAEICSSSPSSLVPRSSSSSAPSTHPAEPASASHRKRPTMSVWGTLSKEFVGPRFPFCGDLPTCYDPHRHNTYIQ
jgi:hypothetical protein